MKQFLAGLMDIIIIYISAYIFYTYFTYNIPLIDTRYYQTDLKSNLFSLVLIVYYGIIPYKTKGATITEYLLKINRFREIKVEETYLIRNKENKILKLAKYFFNRIFIMLLDLFLINIILFIYKKIFKRKK